MYEHFKNMGKLYGDNVSTQIPNDMFAKLSARIKSKNGSTNIQQVSFAYAYIVINALLYKYAHFVDIDNGTYIQNADIKELLGYNRFTKSIDAVIKKNGIIDKIGLTRTTKEYPIQFINNPTEKINDIPLREITTIRELSDDDINYIMIKDIVKNRNYEIKEPVFLFEYEGDNGTLYEYANTHQVTLNELMRFIFDKNLNNIDFMMYCFFKSKCKGLEDDSKCISLTYIISQLGIGKDSFYGHLDKLKQNGFINVNHRGWTMGGAPDLEANKYYFKGI